MDQFLAGTQSIWDVREDKRVSGRRRWGIIALVRMLWQGDVAIVRTERLRGIVRPAEHAHARRTLRFHAVSLEINGRLDSMRRRLRCKRADQAAIGHGGGSAAATEGERREGKEERHAGARRSYSSRTQAGTHEYRTRKQHGTRLHKRDCPNSGRLRLMGA